MVDKIMATNILLALYLLQMYLTFKYIEPVCMFEVNNIYMYIYIYANGIPSILHEGGVVVRRVFLAAV